MSDKIKIELTDSDRGLIRVWLHIPGENLVNLPVIKHGNLWHMNLRLLTEKQEAWLRAANKIHFSQYDIRRLRKNEEISFPVSRERMRSFWQEVHTTRKGMWQRPGTPNLQNV